MFLTAALGKLAACKAITRPLPPRPPRPAKRALAQPSLFRRRPRRAVLPQLPRSNIPVRVRTPHPRLQSRALLRGPLDMPSTSVLEAARLRTFGTKGGLIQFARKKSPTLGPKSCFDPKHPYTLQAVMRPLVCWEYLDFATTLVR